MNDLQHRNVLYLSRFCNAPPYRLRSRPETTSFHVDSSPCRPPIHATSAEPLSQAVIAFSSTCSATHFLRPSFRRAGARLHDHLPRAHPSYTASRTKIPALYLYILIKADKELVHATASALRRLILPLLVSLPGPTSAGAEQTYSSANRRCRKCGPKRCSGRSRSSSPSSCSSARRRRRERDVGAVPARPRLRADVPVGPDAVRRGRAQHDGLLPDSALPARHRPRGAPPPPRNSRPLSGMTPFGS